MQLPVLDLLARYAHLLFALVWVGHNYANFIQNPRFVPLQNGVDVAVLNRDLEARMKREHGVFRYASRVVWLSGLVMLWQRGWLVDALLLQDPCPHRLHAPEPLARTPAVAVALLPRQKRQRPEPVGALSWVLARLRSLPAIHSIRNARSSLRPAASDGTPRSPAAPSAKPGSGECSASLRRTKRRQPH